MSDEFSFEITDEGFDEVEEVVIGLNRQDVSDNAIFVLYSNESVLNVVSRPGCKYHGMMDSQALLFDLIDYIKDNNLDILNHFTIDIVKTGR